MAYVIYSMNPDGSKGEMLSSGQTREQIKRSFASVFQGKEFPENTKLPRFNKALAICWFKGGCYIVNQ